MISIKRDGRTIDHITLEKMRIAALMSVKKGQSPEAVIKSLGMSRSCIYKWLAKYQNGGFEALKAKSISGRPKKITGEMISWIINTLSERSPFEFGLKSYLWDNTTIHHVFLYKFKIKVSLSTIKRLLTNLGISVKKNGEYQTCNE